MPFCIILCFTIMLSGIKFFLLKWDQELKNVNESSFDFGDYLKHILFKINRELTVCVQELEEYLSFVNHTKNLISISKRKHDPHFALCA